MVEAHADDEGETEVTDDKAEACLARIDSAIEELTGLSRAEGVDALIAQLKAIELRRQVALELIRALRPPGRIDGCAGVVVEDGVNGLFFNPRTLLGVDPIDLFVIVFLDGQTAPVSQNSIVREIRERYSMGRAECAAIVRRLESEGVVKRVKAHGRGGGTRWVLVGDRGIDVVHALGVASRTGTEPV